MGKKQNFISSGRLRYADRTLLWTMVFLIGFGFYAIFSASIYDAYYAGESVTKYLFVQAVGVLLGSGIYLACMSFSYRVYLRGIFIFIAVVLCCVLLVLVLTTPQVLGASRWLSLGPLRFQPAELMKIIYVVFLADWCNRYEAHYASDCLIFIKSVLRKGKKRQRFLAKHPGVLSRLFIATGTLVGVTGTFAVLLRLQPDNGSIIIMLTVLVVMLTVVFIRNKLLIGIFGFLLFLGLLGISTKDQVATVMLNQVGTDSHIAVRFRAWLDPFADYEGDGYQLSNSYIAIAKGGVTGVGNGNGSQKQGFLPEIHTDYILANIAEEQGLIGISGILIAFFLMINRLVSVAMRMENKQAKLTLIGIATLLFIQVFWNAGGISGLLPMKGLTAPFLSYGGTSVMFMIITLGVAQGIIAYENHKRFAHTHNQAKQLNQQTSHAYSHQASESEAQAW